MRQRNHLLALVLLALFAAAGVAYFRAYVEPRKPFGIILFVGEGIVSSKLAATRLYTGGADGRLAIDGLPHLALLSTAAADFAVPDSAAAASAVSCGTKVNHRALSVDPGGRDRPTLLDGARSSGRATGLVTTGSLTDPSPAAFYAHASDCRDRESVALQLLGERTPQVILGGGAADLLPASKDGRRRDERDLIQELAGRGHHLLPPSTDLQGILGGSPQKLLGLFDFASSTPAHNRPSLGDMVAAAIDNLQRHKGGYLLVVDAGQAERASLENRSEPALQQLAELDKAIALALRYAGPESLVIVAGGCNTGGMALNGYPLRQDRGVSLLGGINAYGFPSITWATGPSGVTPGATPATNPAASYSPYAANVADDAIAAGAGPGSEALQGFKENTFVYDLIKSQL